MNMLSEGFDELFRVEKYAKPKLSPAFNPEAFSSISFTVVWVMPGPMVFWNITNEPAVKLMPMSLQAFSKRE